GPAAAGPHAADAADADGKTARESDAACESEGQTLEAAQPRTARVEVRGRERGCRGLMPKPKRRSVVRDPRLMPPEDLARLIADSERKIQVMDAFEQSEEWKLQRTRLEKRRDMLGNEMAGLIRRMTRPVATQPGGVMLAPVTPE